MLERDQKKKNIEKLFEMTTGATMEIEEVTGGRQALPLLSLNHVSLMCRSVWDSARFYEDILGFVLIKRPSSFDFNGAWLYNYGIGIHLIENPSVEENDAIDEPRPINPKDNHMSFQCTDVGLVKRRLEEMGVRYVTGVVEEAGVKVDQVFFHDPDGYMVEICNCDNIPILPISSCPFKPKLGSFGKAPTNSCGFMETMMMESLSMDIMNFSF
ncbi:glyoxylase I 4-like isoform X2 [Rhodamnia argentea]|uniref:Glyoxylase I 4-like isoform X2 n=1 Tax=Rhodamnia argentea TaxID=178133 RepID=A0ABM3HRX4_9MYRT|nr:glyoxylase I 4-like isoform X2 [Rhodamnia argentea]